jgi:hypothetical protein
LEKERMNFGLSLNVNDPAPNSITKSLEAECLGLDYIWVADLPSQRYAPVIASAIASATSRIRIGLGLISPFLHKPQQIASSLITLIESYGGRFDLCMGPGDRDELRRVGIDLDTYKDISQYLVNSRREISDILASRDIRCKIWLGAQGPRLLRVASSFDGVLLNYSSPEMIEWALNVIREVGGQRLGSLGVYAPSYVYERYKPEIYRILQFASAAVALGASNKILREFSLLETLEPLRRELNTRRLDGSVLKSIPSGITDKFSILKSQNELPKYVGELERLGVQYMVFSYPQSHSAQTINELATGLARAREQRE